MFCAELFLSKKTMREREHDFIASHCGIIGDFELFKYMMNNKKGNAYDLMMTDTVTFPVGERVVIRTGLKFLIKLDDLCVKIMGRSSTFSKRGILICEGLIDHNYPGEVVAYGINLGKEDVTVHRGDCILQALFLNTACTSQGDFYWLHSEDKDTEKVKKMWAEGKETVKKEKKLTLDETIKDTTESPSVDVFSEKDVDLEKIKDGSKKCSSVVYDDDSEFSCFECDILSAKEHSSDDEDPVLKKMFNDRVDERIKELEISGDLPTDYEMAGRKKMLIREKVVDGAQCMLRWKRENFCFVAKKSIRNDPYKLAMWKKRCQSRVKDPKRWGFVKNDSYVYFF